MQRIVEYV